MNSLSVNLHLFMISFYRPDPPTATGKPRRHKILMEANAFCSDHHVVRSQIGLHGLDVTTSLLLLTADGVTTPAEAPLTGAAAVEQKVAPSSGPEPQHVISTDTILRALEQHGQEISLVLLPGVQFYTGQAFEIQKITEAAHKQGCAVGWDLAHAVGNIPLKLHDWNVDFACWCSYKYLNSGPGAIAGAFLHQMHGTFFAVDCNLHSYFKLFMLNAATKSQQELPRLAGWWGQDPTTRFKMLADWKMKAGAQSYQVNSCRSCILVV